MRKRRQRSYGRQQLRRVQREFLAKYRRVLLAGLGWFAALAAVIVLIPLPYVTGSERGFCLGVVTTTYLAFVGVFFLLDGAGPRLCGLWAEEDWTPQLLADSGQALAVVNRVVFDKLDVDHVAVTPAGVLAVETKWVGSRKEGPWLDAHVSQAAAGAGKIRSLMLSKDIRRSDLPVVPVLMLWGPGSRTLKGRAVERYGVTVLPGPDARPLLARWAEGSVTVGDAQVVEAGLVAFIAMREREPRAKPVGSTRNTAPTARRP